MRRAATAANGHQAKQRGNYAAATRLITTPAQPVTRTFTTPELHERRSSPGADGDKAARTGSGESAHTWRLKARPVLHALGMKRATRVVCAYAPEHFVEHRRSQLATGTGNVPCDALRAATGGGGHEMVVVERIAATMLSL